MVTELHCEADVDVDPVSCVPERVSRVVLTDVADTMPDTERAPRWAEDSEVVRWSPEETTQGQRARDAALNAWAERCGRFETRLAEVEAAVRSLHPEPDPTSVFAYGDRMVSTLRELSAETASLRCVATLPQFASLLAPDSALFAFARQVLAYGRRVTDVLDQYVRARSGGGGREPQMDRVAEYSSIHVAHFIQPRAKHLSKLVGNRAGEDPLMDELAWRVQRVAAAALWVNWIVATWGWRDSPEP